MNLQRKIIHIDMDAFFAAVEERDFPQYKNKPIAVGGPPEARGVIATANYTARKYGVKSAMSSGLALSLCPELVILSPRFDVYSDISKQIRAIFKEYTDLIESLSLDEAFLDVTQDKKQIGSALDIAKEIKLRIFEQFNLTASAGVSINKFIAKVASDINKPNGLTFVGPSKVNIFLENLPINKFFGIGKKTAQKMYAMNIFTGADLKKYSEYDLVKLFGKSGRFFYHIVRGTDNRAVQSHREIKSIGIEDTFVSDINDRELLLDELYYLSKKLEKRLQNKSKQGRTLVLKIKFSDFKTITRSKTDTFYISNADEIYKIASELLSKIDFSEQKIRLLGISITNFYDVELNKWSNNKQLQLFDF